MEKLVYALWAPEGESRADFGARLVKNLPAALKAAGASGIRLNIRDAEVEPAAGLIQQWQAPQQDAIAQFWLPSANGHFRTAIDDIFAKTCGRFEAWLVAESTIIPNTTHPTSTGERLWGWSQASFISFRPDKAWDESVSHWHTHHTRVAIDTQANFEYVQNIIVRALTPGAPDYDAFVEECFPAEGMTDPQVFFDAVGDKEKFDRNLADMMDSCAGFIDFARVDIIPSSQFDFSGLD